MPMAVRTASSADTSAARLALDETVTAAAARFTLLGATLTLGGVVGATVAELGAGPMALGSAGAAVTLGTGGVVALRTASGFERCSIQAMVRALPTSPPISSHFAATKRSSQRAGAAPPPTTPP